MSQRFVQPPGIAPGQWLGSHAAGVSDKERGAIAIDPVQRVGEKTAKEYPWISSILSRMPCTPGTIAGGGGIAAAGTTMRFTRPGGEQSFYNNTNRPIKIDEIRIYSMFCPINIEPTPGVVPGILQIGRQVGLRMWTNKKEYVRDYLPLWQFQTESNRVAESWRFRGLFNFPSNYYLDRGNAFQVRTRVQYGIDPLYCANTIPLPPVTFFRTQNLDMAFGLQGEYVGTKAPAKLMRQVVLPTAGATPVNPLFSTIPFNEGRDSPINDVDVHSLGMGMRDILSTVQIMRSAPAVQFLGWTQLQFVPPQGPKWMGTEDWVPIWGLMDQPGPINQVSSMLVGGDWGPWDHSMIIHRPITPYVLQPREELSIELRALFALNYAIGFFSATPGASAAGTWDDTLLGIPFWCTMYGRQESLA